MAIAAYPELDAIDRELCSRPGGLRHYVRLAWGVIEPQEFQGNWHIDAICDHLEAVSRGEIENLIINIPPRHSKSSTVSVMWPTWEWGPGNQPGSRWLMVASSLDLITQNAVSSRQILESRWYRQRWGDKFQIREDQNQKLRYRNTAGGERVSTTIAGSSLGRGGDRIVLDDPHKGEAVRSETERRKVIDWWNDVLVSRKNNPKTARRVIIMQRLHHGDLVGYLKDTAPRSWEWLVLPTEFEGKTRCQTSIFVDPRNHEGELLWPERFGPAELEEAKRNAHTFAAQHQQRPSLAEGNIFKREWWRFYDRSPADLANEMETLWQSWDMAFKETKTSDFVVGQVWGMKGANRYLFDQIRGRMDFVQTKAAVRMLSEKWPKAKKKLVEDKANGPAIISDLRNSIVGLVAVEPDGSKEARAYAVTPEIESGNVHLPSPANCPWIDEFIEELSAFPKGAHDDQVDTATQALIYAEKIKRQHNLIPISSTPKVPLSSMV